MNTLTSLHRLGNGRREVGIMRWKERWGRRLIAVLQDWGCYSEAVVVARVFFRETWRAEV